MAWHRRDYRRARDQYLDASQHLAQLTATDDYLLPKLGQPWTDELPPPPGGTRRLGRPELQPADKDEDTGGPWNGQKVCKGATVSASSPLNSVCRRKNRPRSAATTGGRNDVFRPDRPGCKGAGLVWISTLL